MVLENENGCSKFQSDHIQRITRTEEMIRQNSEKIKDIEAIVTLIHSINMNVEILAKEMVHQGSIMGSIKDAQVNTQIEVDDIKERMETKDTVYRLHERVDVLEKVNGKLAIRAWLFFGGLITSAVISGLIGYGISGLVN